MTQERVDSRNEAEQQMVQETERMVRDLERAAEESGVPEVSKDTGIAAVVQAIGAVARGQTELGSYVQQTNALIQSNLNEFSKALANTDISAQRAAQASEAVVESLAPEDESSPIESEHPADVEELPEAQLAEGKSKAWWFGKAAYRHGKAS